ncbi:MAG: hypothetical protein J7L73_04330 [Anaerolineales bacterium]|nr:hypothetical protein [Anaerolineales bacterium]
MESVERNGRNWKTKILLLGALVGAITGAGAAYLLIQRAEHDEELHLSPGEGVKLGLSVFSFLKQISQLGD